MGDLEGKSCFPNKTGYGGQSERDGVVFILGKGDTSQCIPAGVVELLTKKPEAPTPNQVEGLPSERQ